MKAKQIFSDKKELKGILSDFETGLKGFDTKVLMVFSSSQHDTKKLSEGLHDLFPGVEVIGATTSGELASGVMSDGAVSAMALSSEVVEDVKIEVVEDAGADGDVKGAFRSFEEYYGEKPMDMDFQKYAGIVLFDGLSLSEEDLMERIGESTDILFVGGSAGDDLKFEQTTLYYKGQTYHNAAILALLKMKAEFDFIKTQSFDVLDKKLVATKVDEETRTVLEFNGKPATEAYAEAIGVKESELEDFFMSNPLGLVAGEEIFVRSPQRVDGQKVVFYCQILEGMEVNVLKGLDIVEDTAKALRDKEKELGSISGIVNFHCILRTLELKNKGLTEEYGNVFSDYPTAGFSTYGEAFLGHINQTSTMLVIK
ncbi:FIST N-terminal domain-containing protein (plasmid) [Rossellomorea sp. AcN35-11]|nr:FIST C-terminal domain-containing protein [Rossellomorea aquimaris]WJV32127.1 FIST N-terminal domain-containing protein [Rossellomorea sp. AcN35-11]